MSDSDSTAMAAEFSDVEGVEEAQDDDGVEKAQVRGMVEGEKATTSGKKKWRVPQDLIDFILAWDVSDYVFPTPDNMDMPISEESKARYCADRKPAVATCRTAAALKGRCRIGSTPNWRSTATLRLKQRPRCLKSTSWRNTSVTKLLNSCGKVLVTIGIIVLMQ